MLLQNNNIGDIAVIIWNARSSVANGVSFLELLGDLFGNGLQLDVGRSLVDGADLSVPVVFLLGEVSGEAHTAHPVYTLGGDCLGHLGRVQLGHGCLLQEGKSGFHQAGGVIGQQARAFYLSCDLRYLMLHCLLK